MKSWKNSIVESAEVDPRELTANPMNWREHPEKQLSALEGVMNTVGWVDKVLVNKRTGHVVDGHARIELALRREEASVPVDFIDVSEEDEKLILATFDPLSAMAATNADILAELVEEVSYDMGQLLDDFLPPLPPGNDQDEDDLDAERSFALYGLDEITQSASSFYRASGFPYPKLSHHECLQEMNKLAGAQINDALLNSAVAYRVADTYNAHRFAASANGQRSPLESFADDVALEKSIRMTLESGAAVKQSLLGFMLIVNGTQACANFRPAFARWLYAKYAVKGEDVLDTSTGYGGRLVGFHCSLLDSKYIGIDPNVETFEANQRMIKDFGINAKLINKPAEDVTAKEVKSESVGFAFTSPPYFCKELYSQADTQSWVRYATYQEWLDGFLRKMLALQYRALKPNRTNVVNIEDVKIKSDVFPLVDDTVRIAEEIGFTFIERLAFNLPSKLVESEDDLGKKRSESVLVFRKQRQ